MRKKVLVNGPALSQSGYGEHTRFLLRSLKTREDTFDIYLNNLNWGKTNWLFEDDDERRWVDFLLQKTILHAQQQGSFDISLQVPFPSILNKYIKILPIKQQTMSQARLLSPVVQLLLILFIIPQKLWTR